MVGAVVAARVIGGTQDVGGGAARHLGGHGLGERGLALVVPAVAAGHHQRRPVRVREIVERPDHGDHALTLARMGEGVDQIVPVQLLHRLAGPDGDGGGRGELVAGAPGAEHRVVERRNRRMEGERACGRRVDQDRVVRLVSWPTNSPVPVGVAAMSGARSAATASIAAASASASRITHPSRASTARASSAGAVRGSETRALTGGCS